MHRLEVVDRLDLNQDLPFHNKVCSISGLKSPALVDNRKWHLALCGMSCREQLCVQALLVNSFKQTRSKLTRHRDGKANDLAGQCVAMRKP